MLFLHVRAALDDAGRTSLASDWPTHAAPAVPRARAPASKEVLLVDRSKRPMPVQLLQHL